MGASGRFVSELAGTFHAGPARDAFMNVWQQTVLAPLMTAGLFVGLCAGACRVRARGWACLSGLPGAGAS